MYLFICSWLSHAGRLLHLWVSSIVNIKRCAVESHSPFRSVVRLHHLVGMVCRPGNSARHSFDEIGLFQSTSSVANSFFFCLHSWFLELSIVYHQLHLIDNSLLLLSFHLVFLLRLFSRCPISPPDYPFLYTALSLAQLVSLLLILPFHAVTSSFLYSFETSEVCPHLVGKCFISLRKQAFSLFQSVSQVSF